MMKRLWRYASYLFVDFANHSSVHGVSYIVEKGRSWFEKVWWIAVLCIAILGCGKLIYDASQINPIIISFVDQPTPIWQVPFPAVTICPKSFATWNLTAIDEREQNGEAVFQSLTEIEKQQTLAKNMFCRRNVYIDSVKNFPNCNECLETLQKMMAPIEESFFDCKFNSKKLDCAAVFEEVIVEAKICYTFNGLNFYRRQNAEAGTSDWNIEAGYGPAASFDTNPRRALKAGLKFGLSVLLRSDNRYHDSFCSEPGFMIDYHMAYESPQPAMFVLMNVSMNVIVKPTMIVTVDELRSYAVEEKKCHFNNERQLKYFVHYTQGNCEIECEIDIALKYCGCLLIFIGSDDRGVDICGPSQANCVSYSRDILLTHNFEQCNCLPACSSMSFESEVFVGALNMTMMSKEHEYTKINIYFNENEFMTKQRTERYGFTDFLASCGGILGLCLGVSVISLLEIVYFCTLRLWIASCRRGDGKTTVLLDHFPTRSKIHPGVFQNLISDYFKKTTIQGVKYVATLDLSLFERIWWVIIVAMSMVCCGCLISDVFNRYDQTPVIISYANEETSITAIPFPAVTICPQIVSGQAANMYNYFKVYNLSLYSLDAESIIGVTAVSQVCEPEIYDSIDPSNITSCEHCSEHLKLVMGNVDYIFKRCSHFYPDELCSELFKPVVTEGGACFVSNSIDVLRQPGKTLSGDWTLDGGYRNSAHPIFVYPRTGSKTSYSTTMAVYKYMNDGLCKGAVRGFKVYLHMPNEVPQITKNFFLAPYKHFLQVMINPRMTVTAPELRDLPVTKRQCYFSDERYLQFFRFYTKNNCEVECLVNLTMSKCGCLMFYMPAIPGVKFCGISDIKCHQGIVQNNVAARSSDCLCWPTCNSIAYDTEINNILLTDDLISGFYGRKFNEEFDLAEIDMMIKGNRFVALRRSQLYGKTEFLANCGGLLGLFLGFSIISVMEFLYFCTIRMCCDMRMKVFGK